MKISQLQIFKINERHLLKKLLSHLPVKFQCKKMDKLINHNLRLGFFSNGAMLLSTELNQKCMSHSTMHANKHC